MEQKIEYLLNAVCYFLFRFRIRAGKCFDSVFFGFFTCLGFWLPKKFRVKYYARNAEAKESLYLSLCAKKHGIAVHFAEHTLIALLIFYFSLPTGLILGILTNIYFFPPLIFLSVIALTLSVHFWFPYKKMVFKDYRYLKYFKKFEKEDKQWHRKWALITVAFCIGSLLSAAFGIYLCFACAIGRFDLWNLMARG